MMTTEDELVSVIESFKGKLIDAELDDMISLCRAGECGVALENLSTQLYEYDVFPSVEVLAVIERLARALHRDPEVWKRLRRSS